MKKIFVGNLAWKVTADMLKQLFETYGAVTSANVVTDQYTGQSRGFGFVVMENADDATKAITALNDQPLLDRNIRVSLAIERAERGERSGGGGGGGERFGGAREPRGDRGSRRGGGGGGYGGGGGSNGNSRGAPHRQRQSDDSYFE